MAKRRKIGIIYQYNENWIGGTYYIQNLIAALNRLPDDDKYELVIFTEDDRQFEGLVNATRYPLLTRGAYVKRLPLLQRVANRAARKVINKNIFSVFNKDIDVVFPATNNRSFKKRQSFLFWIADFQEHYLPEFFTAKELAERKRMQDDIVRDGKHILFSSESAKNDFNKIHPSNTLQQFVLRFAVTHPVLKNCNAIIEKYQLSSGYFICCNQFWQHKNHAVIFKAVHLLKQQGHEVFVVFTGKEDDYRHPDFFNGLTVMIDQLDIQNNVKLLGFIGREDQLCLMKNSLAVIQPSLFEGWSTVVEDAKALEVKIIASDIAVHKEQLEQYKSSTLFQALDERELAALMVSTAEMPIPTLDYDKNIKTFAENFKLIIETISPA